MKKKFINFLLVFFVIGLFTFFTYGNVFAAETKRIAGIDRYETSLQISQNNWTTANTVILATGHDFADALCATPLAKKCNAPIILVDNNNTNDNVMKEINRLGAKNIYLIGGEGVVSKDIENTLIKMGTTVKRLSGIDRYETSLAIAKEMGTTSKVVLTVGDKFPDAISISAPAAIEGMPILLANKDGVSDKTDQYINSVKRDKVYIVGGNDIISDAVKDKYNAIRISGDNRVDTNIAVLKQFSNDFNMNKIFVASALDFPDGLSGAAAAVLYQSPVLLVADGYMDSTINYISSNVNNSSSTYEILGGIGAVSSKIEKQLTSGNSYSQTVVIDAGHGGYDSGAVGPNKTLEKNINLAVALKLGAILKSSGINVIYTRTSDTVSWSTDINNDLQTRCDIANNAKADFFISIHCNSTDSSSAHGTEDYYSRDKTQDSKYAQIILDSLVEANGLSKRYANESGFYVVKNTNMPAVLAELAFISNPDEEKLLNTEDFQNKCAVGLANGVLQVLNKLKQ